jgi:hypothetical protein
VPFHPQLTREDAVALAARYKVAEDEPALEAGRRIKAGEFSRIHLQTVYTWKTNNRGKSRLEFNTDAQKFNTDAQIEDALWLATIAKEPRSAIAVLTGLYGVAVPVASAIATAIDPDRYTVLDFRALQALGNPVGDRTVPFYLEYLDYCKGLAASWELSLRDLDRALWQWSKDRGPSPDISQS